VEAAHKLRDLIGNPEPDLRLRHAPAVDQVSNSSSVYK
jgi:hypothetical protein